MAKLELATEYPPANEAELVPQVLKLLTGQYEKMYAGKKQARRSFHPKHHGAVRAELIVEPKLAKDLRHGIFKTARSYPVWIRFSNGAQKDQSDRIPDLRGMAIKVMEVEGEKLLEDEKTEQTQDFLLINTPAMFAKNIEDAIQLFGAIVRNNPLLFFFGGINPLRWHLREMKNLITGAKQKAASPLTIRYWSTTPYRLGPHAIKFSLVPAACAPAPAIKSRDHLRETMAAQLKEDEARFDFMVQLQTDPVAMPIEDPTLMWDEAASPYRKVATVRIPKQTFDTPERMTFCENLSFTPWHSLPEHQPLGGVNRIRKIVYETFSKLRHERNQAARQEPTGTENI